MFARELGKRISGSGVTVCSLHPGTIHTDLPRYHLSGWRAVQKVQGQMGCDCIIVGTVQLLGCFSKDCMGCLPLVLVNTESASRSVNDRHMHTTEYCNPHAHAR